MERHDPKHAPAFHEPDRVRQGVGSLLFVVALCLFITFLGIAEELIAFLKAWLEEHT